MKRKIEIVLRYDTEKEYHFIRLSGVRLSYGVWKDGERWVNAYFSHGYFPTKEKSAVFIVNRCVEQI